MIDDSKIENENLLKFTCMTYHQFFFNEVVFFDAEYHVRRYLLQKNATRGSQSYFFDSGSFYKDREILINRFRNKVLQNSLVAYEKWIEQLKVTEANAMEISVWAQSLNEKLQAYEQGDKEK
ncbi:MAG: hypothetical protein XXXJIFNMEKO3_00828 [Candidatus Erwinia impunctatus]|nr:hypothetical protein XXXJIFNMEKO_00828 [Culicoides impunctatus]